MRCSVSWGVYPGACALICTCTLVMSGTASMGRREKFQTPSPATPRARIRMSQRCRSENDTSLSMIMAGLPFTQFRLQHETVPGDIHGSGHGAFEQLHEASITPPRAHGSRHVVIF